MPKIEPSFEELLAELEAAVQKLEAGNLPLDESLTLYERGMELARQCNERLDRAELRVKELAPASSGEGEPDLFADDEEAVATEE